MNRPVHAKRRDGGAGSGNPNWSAVANWDGDTTLPTTSDNAYLGSASGISSAAGLINTAGMPCSTLYMGYAAPQNGRLNVTGGDLTAVVSAWAW
ncbi:MAG: hypothetical protein HQ523_00655 [Lentisphaerae bacterium]|nr:hypothetical protein [Lentisphaerota bacterium]